MMNIRTYSELSRLKTFDERYHYLQLKGNVGESTFGFDRIFNQMFYKSDEWKFVRRDVILRDNGCDLGVEGHEIYDLDLYGRGISKGRVIIHHMNPISIKDIERRSDMLLDPEYLISTILSTHNAIHYGDTKLLYSAPVERTRNDMCPWKN